MKKKKKGTQTKTMFMPNHTVPRGRNFMELRAEKNYFYFTFIYLKYKVPLRRHLRNWDSGMLREIFTMQASSYIKLSCVLDTVFRKLQSFGYLYNFWVYPVTIFMVFLVDFMYIFI